MKPYRKFGTREYRLVTPAKGWDYGVWEYREYDEYWRTVQNTMTRISLDKGDVPHSVLAWLNDGTGLELENDEAIN